MRDSNHSMNHLFVYGSLLSGIPNVMGRRLRAEALFLGTGRAAGRLYRVSWYPGAKETENPLEVVQGELYRLASPVHTLAWLDDYEGIAPGQLSAADANEYARVATRVARPDGTSVMAWIYYHQRPLPPSAFIADGIWRG